MELGDIREDLGGLKQAVRSLTESVQHMDKSSTDAFVRFEKKSAEARGRLYAAIERTGEKVNDVQQDVESLRQDVEGVKARLGVIEPITQDVGIWKQRLVGVGIFVTLVWGTLVALIAYLWEVIVIGLKGFLGIG